MGWVLQQLLLVLAGMLPLIGAATTHAWSTGAHVTPAQWAFHRRLEQQGIADHHHPQGSEQGDAGAAVGRLQPFAEAVVASASSMPPSIAQGALLLVAVALATLAPAVVGRPFRDPVLLLPGGMRPAPPDQPPERCS